MRFLPAFDMLGRSLDPSCGSRPYRRMHLVKTNLALLALVLGVSGLLAPDARADFPALGKPPPEINAKSWFNNLGAEPRLADLKGQVVLIEFWATWCPPCRAAWPHLNELYSTYAKDGLVAIGLSDEVDDKVDPFITEFKIQCLVGGGSTSNGAYGVDGIPHTFIVGPDGNLAWHGHPSELKEDLLKTLLKGARKPVGGPLGVRMNFDVDARVSKAQALAAEGKLADSLKELGAIDADPKSSDQQKNDAKAVREAIDHQGDALCAAAEKAVASQDVEKAVTLLELVSKELGSSAGGAKAKARLEQIHADKRLMAELESARAFLKLQEQVKTLATAKQRGRYEEFAKHYAGTKAGERAKQLARTPEKG